MFYFITRLILSSIHREIHISNLSTLLKDCTANYQYFFAYFLNLEGSRLYSQTMEALCSLCMQAVTRLHHFNLPQEKRVTIRHPRHEAAIRKRCWICFKFSVWLEREYPGAFQSWEASDGLDIVYSRDFYQIHTVTCTLTQQSVRIFDFDMRPSDTCGIEVDHSCGIRCQLVPFQGERS